MTGEQRQRLEALREQIGAMANYCNRAEGYLTDAEQEPDNERVDTLLQDVEELVALCKE